MGRADVRPTSITSAPPILPTYGLMPNKACADFILWQQNATAGATVSRCVRGQFPTCAVLQLKSNGLVRRGGAEPSCTGESEGSHGDEGNTTAGWGK